MIDTARPAAPAIGASIGAVAAGLLAAGIGFLAATAQGMATAPSQWAGLVPLGIIAVGLGLTVLGLVSLPVPGLRSAARTGAVVILIGFVGLFVLSRVISAIGLYGG
ncbi:hypothetical protein [Sphingosinicella sp. CPCC 101087]|uniref:hypothetical protein n=1 Tax=Sphingosinicella sp. CPCC 101087 TaxID=2497754 RepID=UPI00101CA294|nr:hypothetical protein [Sphingosinicella sp. CPCC 101087]